MNASLLLAVTLAVQQGPTLSVEADRTKLMVGEELSYTVTAVAAADQQLKVQILSVDGFEIIGRTERTDVGFNPPRRSSLTELRLRALRPGTFRLGPVTASAGQITVTEPGVTVEVSESRGAVAATINPRVASLLNRATPPGLAGDVGLSVYLSTDTVMVGEQVDIVTAAWFPRDLRLRLRRPPTLSPPEIEGWWNYPQPAPVGIAASRRVAGSWYDLFVGHEVVFPLTPGEFTLEPATLRYSVPLALQFFSQEERLTRESGTPSIVVVPLPDEGRPVAFNGAVARRLRLSWDSPSGAKQGNPFTVALVVSGQGNVSLWPEPQIDWPDQLRAYRDRTEERISPSDGRVAGEKRFHYVVVPQSPGRVVLPAVSYPYFDLASNSYREATPAAPELAVAPGPSTAAVRGLPPPLLISRGPSLASRLSKIPWTVLLALWLLPPLAALWLTRRRPPRVRGRKLEYGRSLKDAERYFEKALRRYVSDPETRSPEDLNSSLRVAGTDESTARRIVELREALLSQRYGPQAGGDELQLARQVFDVVDQLRAVPRRGRRSSHGVAALLLGCLMVLPQSMKSQGPTAEQFYQSGALESAVAGFWRMVHDNPDDAAGWYNLGASYYRLGEDGAATAAWQRALRLDPDNGAIRRALQLIPSVEPGASRELMVPPVTFSQVLAAAYLLWLIGWLGIIWHGRRRRRWMVTLAAALAFAGAGLALQWWHQRPRAIVLHESVMRLSPHGLAPERSVLPEGSVVRLESGRAGWWLARSLTGSRGWLPAASVEPISGYLPSYETVQ